MQILNADTAATPLVAIFALLIQTAGSSFIDRIDSSEYLTDSNNRVDDIGRRRNFVQEESSRRDPNVLRQNANLRQRHWQQEDVDLQEFLAENPNLERLQMFRELRRQRDDVMESSDKLRMKDEWTPARQHRSDPPLIAYPAENEPVISNDGIPLIFQPSKPSVRRSPATSNSITKTAIPFLTDFDRETFSDISAGEPYAINPSGDFDWETAGLVNAAPVDNKVFVDPDLRPQSSSNIIDEFGQFEPFKSVEHPVLSGVKNMATSSSYVDDASTTPMFPHSTTFGFDEFTRKSSFHLSNEADNEDDQPDLHHQASHTIAPVAAENIMTITEKAIERTTMATTTMGGSISSRIPMNTWSGVIDITDKNSLNQKLSKTSQSSSESGAVDEKQLYEFEIDDQKKVDRKDKQQGTKTTFDDENNIGRNGLNFGNLFEQALKTAKTLGTKNSKFFDPNVKKSKGKGSQVPDLIENPISRAVAISEAAAKLNERYTITTTSPPLLDQTPYTPYYTKELLNYKDLYHPSSKNPTTVSDPLSTMSTATTPNMTARQQRLLVGGIRTQTSAKYKRKGLKNKLAKGQKLGTKPPLNSRIGAKKMTIPRQRVFITNPALFGHDLIANPGVFFNGSRRPMQQPVEHVKDKKPRIKQGSLNKTPSVEATTVKCCGDHVHSGGNDLNESGKHFSRLSQTKLAAGVKNLATISLPSYNETKEYRSAPQRRSNWAVASIEVPHGRLDTEAVFFQADQDLYALKNTIDVNGGSDTISKITQIDTKKRSSLFDCFRQERDCILVNELPVERRIGLSERECLNFCISVPFCESVCYAQHLLICDVYNVKNGTGIIKLVKLQGYVYYEPRMSRLDFCNSKSKAESDWSFMTCLTEFRRKHVNKNVQPPREKETKPITQQRPPPVQIFEPPLIDPIPGHMSNEIDDDRPHGPSPTEIISKGECPASTDIVFHRMNGWRLPPLKTDQSWKTDEENCIFSCLVNTNDQSTAYACSSATFDFATDRCTISSRSTVFSARKHRDVIPNSNSIYYEKSCVPADLAVQCAGRHIERHPQMLLLESARAVKTVQSLYECTDWCFSMRSFRCVSLVYFLDETSYNCIMNNESRVTQPLLFVEEFESRVEYVGLDDCMTTPSGRTHATAAGVKQLANKKLQKNNWSFTAKRRHSQFVKKKEDLEDLGAMKGSTVALDGGNHSHHPPPIAPKKRNKAATKTTKSLLKSMRNLPRRRIANGKMNYGRRYSVHPARSKMKPQQDGRRGRTSKRRRTSRT